MSRHDRSRTSTRRNGRPRPALERLEDRCLLTSVAEFPIRPNGGTPFDITSGGSDGDLWFTTRNSTGNGNVDQYDQIGIMNPSGVVLQQVALPKLNAGVGAIALGPDNNYWFLETAANQIGVINATTHAVTEYPLLATPNAGLEDLTAGPDGNIWFTETNANKVGVFNLTTHAITEFPVQTLLAEPFGITWNHKDGLLWFTEEGIAKLGSINPTTYLVTEYPIKPAGSNYEPQGIAADQDGKLWFTDYGTNQVDMFNPTAGTFAATPTALPTNYQTGSITRGPDGNVWLSEIYQTIPSAYGQLGVINVANGQLTNYSESLFGGNALGGLTSGPGGQIWITSNSNGANGPEIAAFNRSSHTAKSYLIPTQYNISAPARLTFGPDGKVWFVLPAGSYSYTGEIGTIDPLTQVTTLQSVPTTQYQPQDVTVGPDGNLWFTETPTGSFSTVTGKIGIINPSTGAMSDYLVPTASASPLSITGDPGDGDVWFTEESNNQIGRVIPSSKAINDSIKVPAADSEPYDIVADSRLW
ncbi:MAG: SMP-30/gluconolactonase/LRE family protein [Isosphaeraceae bacterium]|nr:SMP-30/gluconolactonase/LRE family protein [Isosphaeraceae bacterium]